VLPPHPPKNTRVALPMTAINFIASICSSSRPLHNTRTLIALSAPTLGASEAFDQWMKAGTRLGMILTVQVAEKGKLAAHTTAPTPGQPDRWCYTPEQRRHPWQ